MRFSITRYDFTEGDKRLKPKEVAIAMSPLEAAIFANAFACHHAGSDFGFAIDLKHKYERASLGSCYSAPGHRRDLAQAISTAARKWAEHKAAVAKAGRRHKFLTRYYDGLDTTYKKDESDPLSKYSSRRSYAQEMIFKIAREDSHLCALLEAESYSTAAVRLFDLGFQTVEQIKAVSPAEVVS